MARPSLAPPSRAAPHPPTPNEGVLLAAFRRLAPTEQAKAVRLILELETAAQRTASEAANSVFGQRGGDQ